MMVTFSPLLFLSDMERHDEVLVLSSMVRACLCVYDQASIYVKVFYPLEVMMKYIFTDGSATKNGKVGCQAAYAIYFGVNDTRNVARRVFTDPSNQRAELAAIKEALDIIATTTKTDEQHTIVTDSEYSIKCLTLWYTKWKLNGWKRADGQDVKHLDLIQPSLLLLSERPCILQHIRSHKSQPKDKSSIEYSLWLGNKRADEMAKSVISQLSPSVE